MSAALLASSCVGEFGDDPIGVPETMPEVVDRPVRLPLLLTWCNAGGERAESSAKEGVAISWVGDSNADDGAVPDALYFGVNGSLGCDWFM